MHARWDTHYSHLCKALAVQIFSAVPVSMVDECAMSVVTWLNNLRWKQQQVSTIANHLIIWGFNQLNHNVCLSHMEHILHSLKQLSLLHTVCGVEGPFQPCGPTLHDPFAPNMSRGRVQWLVPPPTTPLLQTWARVLFNYMSRLPQPPYFKCKMRVVFDQLAPSYYAPPLWCEMGSCFANMAPPPTTPHCKCEMGPCQLHKWRLSVHCSTPEGWWGLGPNDN